MNLQVEMRVYRQSKELWSVLKVLEHGSDRMKRLVWSELDSDSKRILTDAKAESDAMVG